MAKKSLVIKQRRPQRFKVRSYTRCNRCGRPRAVFRKFGLCRICLRELAHERVISGLRRISKPGRRVYARKDRLPRVLGGMGTAILSTSSGLVTSRTAAERGVGGGGEWFVLVGGKRRIGNKPNEGASSGNLA